ncbi:MAG TPA: protein translocase subunit SecD, partial [Verrucomicrobiae bacterium]|nr:protein translocase subunit SecD [Verrucomicrobiae bacterium]
MNRNNLWKFIFVLIVLTWSFYEMYPPVGTNLAVAFQQKSEPARRDATYKGIVDKLQALQQQRPDKVFGNIVEAVGTNDITKYFPDYDINPGPEANRKVLDKLQRASAGKIKLGLDLQGGYSFLLGMNTATIDTNRIATKDQALSQAVEVLRRRVDRFGVAEPIIQPEGADRIRVQLPGLSEADKEDAETNLAKAAYLEFRMVHTNSEQMVAEGLNEPGYVPMIPQEKSDDPKAQQPRPLLVQKTPVMTGEHIQSAFVSRNQTGQAEIEFTLDGAGAEIFGKVTEEYIHQRLGIVLDGQLVSAPVINSPITGGRGVIEGRFTDKEAQDLAADLENPLSAPLKVLSESSVDPTLGIDTVKSGVRAAIIGTVLVAGFMAVYYLFAGVVANVALMCNIIILIGVMCLYGTTLTLPGIAGVVLTIGMAVDANVLIFERIREESAKGKSMRGALEAGYARAFGTIFDSHVTTLISSVTLVFMGTGPIKGFGVTLTIGVAASLFTALVVTRLIFDFLLARGLLKKLPMMHIIRATKLDFMKLGNAAFALTWTIIVIGIAYGGYRLWDKKNLLGVDFAGGDNITLSFKQKVDNVDQLRAAITRDGKISDPGIQYEKQSSGAEYLRVTSKFQTANTVEQVLKKDFPSAGFERKAVETVGPIIGQEIEQTAVVASVVSLFLIMLYVAVRYEFSFAVGAILAVIHDILMTIGCYCLSGREFNATMVAAVLTIIGFSMNDTVVIFDRIREDLKLGVRGSFKDLINQALNQTLSRTIITSGTVFLATISLYVFGGGAINDFAFTFLVGIITGTYSSIYIASFLVLKWHKGQRPRTSTQV